MTLAGEQTTDEKPEMAPERPREEQPQPPSLEAKKPTRRRPSRRGKRKKRTRAETAAGWLTSKFGRIGGVLFTPKKTFEEIAANPDYFGVVFITVAAMLATVGAHYILWATKMNFFDVDLHKYVSQPFPYGYYVLSEGFSFGVWYLTRNFLIYYFMSWALGGERDAGLLLLCTGYSLGTQLVGRLLQAFVFYAVFPPVTYQVSTETSIMLLTASSRSLGRHHGVQPRCLEGLADVPHGQRFLIPDLRDQCLDHRRGGGCDLHCDASFMETVRAHSGHGLRARHGVLRLLTDVEELSG